MSIRKFWAVTLLASLASPVMAADVGVSISVGDPGFYGRIDINQAPRPRLVYAEPRVVERVRYIEQPVYLRVPPGHAKHWDKHCREYSACNRPVYFVDDSWYETVYVPDYRSKHGSGKGSGPGGYQDRHDDDDHDHGHGNGNGKGNGKGHGRGND